MYAECVPSGYRSYGGKLIVTPECARTVVAADMQGHPIPQAALDALPEGSGDIPDADSWDDEGGARVRYCQTIHPGQGCVPSAFGTVGVYVEAPARDAGLGRT